MYVHGKFAIFRPAYLSNKLLFAEHRSGELEIIGFSLEWLARVSPKSRSGFSRHCEGVIGITTEGWFIGGRRLKRGNFVRRILSTRTSSFRLPPPSFLSRNRPGVPILGGSYRSVGAIMARIITRIIRTRAMKGIEDRWSAREVARLRSTIPNASAVLLRNSPAKHSHLLGVVPHRKSATDATEPGHFYSAERRLYR